MTSNSPASISGTDNEAQALGYTKQLMAEANCMSMHISVRPDADLDGVIRAFDHDNQEYILLNGWMWEFEPVLS